MVDICSPEENEKKECTNCKVESQYKLNVYVCILKRPAQCGAMNTIDSEDGKLKMCSACGIQADKNCIYRRNAVIKYVK